jgi:inorganic pyrophosphatase
MDLKKMIFFIEIPEGSDVKYEVDEETGMIMADRFLYTSMGYPANYGYVVGTKGKDGDPVDVLVLSSKRVVPGVGIKGHVIGMLEMEDEEGIDSKLLAVPDKKVDPIFGVYEDLKDIPKPMLDKIKHFFETYKQLEPGKWVKVKDFKDKSAAEKEVMESIAKAQEDCDCDCKGGEDCKCDKDGCDCCGECGCK